MNRMPLIVGAAILALVGSACSSPSSSPNSSAPSASGIESGAVQGTTTQPTTPSTAIGSTKYMTGMPVTGSTMKFTVDRIVDPADATSSMGVPTLNDTHFVVVEITGAGTTSRSAVFAPTCFKITTAKGDPDPQLWVTYTTKGGKPLGGSTRPSETVSGQVTWELKNGDSVKTITYTCSNENVTATVQ